MSDLATRTTAVAERETAVDIRRNVIDGEVVEPKRRFSIAGVTFTVTGAAMTILGVVGIVAGWNGVGM